MRSIISEDFHDAGDRNKKGRGFCPRPRKINRRISSPAGAALFYGPET
jgi:hypothetical protein